jgi:hypothetical protein
MNVTHTMCDRAFCNNDQARSIFIFKERKADGAGSSEEWHYKFDLCPSDQQALLNEIFDHVRYKQALTAEDALAILNKLLIKFRVE